MDINARLKALDMSVVAVADGCCEGCKGESMLKYDADCYIRCDVFAAEVAAMEQP